jgi:hypothetical protein
MLRTVTILFLTLLSFTLIAQSTSQSQKTLLTKRTATWCPNCGTWGWDMAKGLEELQNENAILIRAHYSGTLESQASIDITENFEANYQPEFFINEERQNVGSSTWSSKLSLFDEMIDANAQDEANVSIRISSTYLEDKITADVTMKVMKAIQGEYFLGVYLLEDGVVANQASQGQEAIHNGVLRMSFTEGSFGNLVVENNAEPNFESKFSETIEVEGEAVMDRNFKVLVIVWKKVGQKYIVENVHENIVSMFSSTEYHAEDISEINVYQSLGKIIVDANHSLSLLGSRVDLHTIDGQSISSVVLADKNMNEIDIDVNKWSGKIVLVRILGKGGNLLTKKLIIK